MHISMVTIISASSHHGVGTLQWTYHPQWDGTRLLHLLLYHMESSLDSTTPASATSDDKSKHITVYEPWLTIALLWPLLKKVSLSSDPIYLHTIHNVNDLTMLYACRVMYWLWCCRLYRAQKQFFCLNCSGILGSKILNGSASPHFDHMSRYHGLSLLPRSTS